MEVCPGGKCCQIWLGVCLALNHVVFVCERLSDVELDLIPAKSTPAVLVIVVLVYDINTVY